MAKAEKPKKDGARGRSKAASRAGTRTAENKARAAETRQRRHNAAENRRSSDSFVIPMEAMIPISELPKGARGRMREQFPHDTDESGNPIMIPDPKRGTISKKGVMEVISRRIAQSRKVAVKRTQRRNFSKLTPKQKREHREAGIAHKIPR